MGGEYDMAHGFSTPDVYSDTISSGAVGATWSSTPAYPSESEGGANTCAAYNGYLYCVATYGSTGEAVNYAAITSGTLGTWTAGPDYPIYVVTDQVVISGGYIYGVGGQSNAAYYSLIGSSSSTSSTTSSTTTTTTTSSTTTTTSTTVSTTNTPPPPSNQCEYGLDCYTVFAAFNVISATGAPVGGATVVISATGVTSQMATTASVASTSTLCTLNPAWTAEWGSYWGCNVGSTGPFTLSAAITYSYTVTLPSGTVLTGSIGPSTTPGTSPWTVTLVTVSA
jgi:hypothetical protein